MQVVVLLGGLGTRLRGRYPDLPKPMVDVHGRPFIYYQLQLMKWSGLRDFVFCVGHKGEIIKSLFKDGRKLGINIKYSFDGEEPLGTGGAIKKATPLLKKDFMVVYGDSYMDVNYTEIISAYHKFKKEKKQKSLMVVFRNKNRYDKSNVVFRNGVLLRYDKNNRHRDAEHIDYGISILDKNLLGIIPRNEYFDLSEAYAIFVRKGLMAGYEVKNRFYEIGTPDSLEEFKRFIFKRAFVKKPAVILDRDGTLNEICFNEETGHLDSPLRPEELKLLPGAAQSLRIIKSLGYAVIVVTNQPQAAKGKTTLDGIFRISNKFKDILAKKGVYMNDILICPHHPVGSPTSKERFLIKDCDCRKPKPGLLKIAIEKFNLDTANSYVAGDSYVDVLAGKSAKVKTVFLGEYKCDVCQALKGHKPDYIFKDLHRFADFLRREGRKSWIQSRD